MGTKAKMGRQVRVADEAWIALALLHHNDLGQESFTAREILDRVKAEKVNTELRPGIQAHIYLHNVANVAPNSARYRMFYREANDTYRLFRPRDDFHPARRGKTKPAREEVPATYHYLLDWYER